MSRCSGRHAKIPSRYEGRHIKPGTPGPAALVGTAAKAVPVSLMAGAAGSALVLSGTASAATAPAGLVHGDAADLAAVKNTALATSASLGRHADATAVKTVLAASVRRGRHGAPHSVYTVVPGDTLSSISARFCGTAADYPSLAAASGISDPNVIDAGQTVKLSCHHAVPAAAPSEAAPAAPASATSDQAPAQPAQPAQAASTSGMSAFESCVIARESGGNPAAVNPVTGAGGLFQFLPSTWAALGFSGLPENAPVAVQEQAFAEEYAQAGTAPWAPYDGC